MRTESLDHSDHRDQHHWFCSNSVCSMELYCHFEGLYACAMTDISFRTDEAESRTVELESMIRECEDDGHQIDLLRDYARRTHCGLILNGGFVEKETPNTQTLISYDMMGGINAGNLARRSLEDLRPTEGHYESHRVMLEAANQGAIPSEAPLTKAFRPGKRDLSMRAEHVREQSIQRWGRLDFFIGQLDRRLELLVGRGRGDLSDTVERERERERYELLLAIAEERRSLR